MENTTKVIFKKYKPYIEGEIKNIWYLYADNKKIKDILIFQINSHNSYYENLYFISLKIHNENITFSFNTLKKAKDKTMDILNFNEL